MARTAGRQAAANPAVPLGRRRTARLWVSRFIVLPIFALSAVAFGSIGLQLYDRDGGLADVPADYAKTEIATRGDVGDIDDRRLVASLPGLAASLATATRLEAGRSTRSARMT